MFHSFLIKYGEIGIKGKNRYLFEDMLVSQINYTLKSIDGEFHVYKQQGRIYVECGGNFDFDEQLKHFSLYLALSASVLLFMQRITDLMLWHRKSFLIWRRYIREKTIHSK